jgi:hypothetical protein
MGRSGGRPNISVAAPFVWRCLTGSALVPFSPHLPIYGSEISALCRARPPGPFFAERNTAPGGRLALNAMVAVSRIPACMHCRRACARCAAPPAHRSPAPGCSDRYFLRRMAAVHPERTPGADTKRQILSASIRLLARRTRGWCNGLGCRAGGKIEW